MGRLLTILRTSTILTGYPLQLNPVLLLQNTRVDGYDTESPIMTVRRVTEGDEVDIYGYNPADPRQYKTTSEAIGGLGADLITNGTFDTDTTGWSTTGSATIAVVSGELELTTTDGGVARYGQGFTTVIGTSYKATTDFRINNLNGPANFKATNISNFSGNIGDTSLSSDGTFSFVFVATATTTYIVGNTLGGDSIGDTCFFDNLSVKEVIGGYYEPNEDLLYPNEQFFVPAWFGQDGVLGAELIPTIDFTSGWTNFNSTDTADTFTITDTAGGVYYNNLLTVGQRYEITVEGTVATAGTGTFYVSNGFASRIDLFTTSLDGAFTYTGKFTAVYDELYLRLASSAIGDSATITSISVKKIGNSAYQGTASEQPELIWEGATVGSELVTNGDFANWTADDPDNWSVSGEVASDPMITEVSGACRMYASAAIIQLRQTIATDVSKYYKFGMDITAAVSGGLTVNFVDGSTIDTYTASGVKEKYFKATGTNFNLKRSNNPMDFTFDNVSVKEVLTWDYPTLQFDGADDWMVMTGMTHAASDYSAVFRLKQPDVTETQDFLFDVETGRLNFRYPSAANNAGYLSGAGTTQQALITNTDWFNLSFSLEATDKGEIYENTTVKAANKEFAQRAIGARIGLGSSFLGSSVWYGGKMKAVQIYPKAITENQVIKLNTYIDGAT